MTRDPDAVLAAANAMLGRGSFDDAITCLTGGCSRHPRHARLTARLADALHAAGRLQRAAEIYADALALDDQSAETWYAFGCLHLTLKAYGAASQALGRATELAPAMGVACYNFGKALFELGHVEAAIVQFERAAALDPSIAPMARGSIACIVPGSTQAGNAGVRRARSAWAAETARDIQPCARKQRATQSPTCRIGYMSAFFGARNWMKPVYALINRHDRARFDVHMFSDGDLPCAASGYRDYELDMIYDLRGVGNDQAASIIAGAELDILVDLNGYSCQRRLPVLMQKPAPVIVGWFNMFATTGISAVDWLIGDAAVIPESEENFYTERIHRLAGTYLAFNVLYPVPDVSPPPCLVAGGTITFGCLGSHYKLTDATLSAWASILHAAPHARLFIKNSTLEDPSVRTELLGRLGGRGIDPARVMLDGASQHLDFLSAYRHVDIALDTFPYNGGTTTTEAIWQGVPVLTFDGDRWASRTSKSLLLAAGLQDWVMADAAGYARRATDLANDPATPGMLASLRASLRDRVRASAAYDAAGLCEGLEAFYLALSGEERKNSVLF